MKIYVNLRLQDRHALAACYWFNASAKTIGLMINKDESGNIYIDPNDDETEPMSQAYDRFLLDRNGRIIKM